MIVNEDDLRTLLDQRSDDPPVAPGLAEEATRLGRRAGRRRRTTGTALAACAVTATVVVLPQWMGSSDPSRAPLRQPGMPIAQQLVLPQTMDGVARIAGERFSSVGTGAQITFTPRSEHTRYWIHCDDPDAWVVTWDEDSPEGEGGHVGRCGETGMRMGETQASVPSGWVGQEQSFSVWVFPEKYERTLLPKTSDDPTEAAERLAAELPDQAGSWAVGVYDSRDACRPPGNCGSAVTLPATFEGAPRIHTEHFSTYGKAQQITFTPRSNYTRYWIRCADPQAWVVTFTKEGAGGESSGGVGQCGPTGAQSANDKSSVPAGWVGREQSFTVWVFPGEFDIDPRTFYVNEARRLAERLPDHYKGAWAVGVYDSPDACPPPEFCDESN